MPASQHARRCQSSHCHCCHALHLCLYYADRSFVLLLPMLFSILHRYSDAAIIIPVNSTVGRSGCVLVTFKSTSSVPPYRIENRTKAVMIHLRQQVDLVRPTPALVNTLDAVIRSDLSSARASLSARKQSSAARYGYAGCAGMAGTVCDAQRHPEVLWPSASAGIEKWPGGCDEGKSGGRELD